MPDSSVVTCDFPGKVANGRSLWDSEEYPKYGEIIYYFCNDGYALVGKNHIMCGETGEYDEQPPECNGKSMYKFVCFFAVKMNFIVNIDENWI